MTPTLFAIAGLAEAAFASVLMECWASLFLIAGVDIAACVRRSWKLSLTAFILLLLFSSMYSPWMGFKQTDPYYDGGFDADVVFWNARFERMAIIWSAETIFTCVLLPTICILERQRRCRKPQDESQSDLKRTISHVLFDWFLSLLILVLGSIAFVILVGL
jgi:hypothetical protein